MHIVIEEKISVNLTCYLLPVTCYLFPVPSPNYEIYFARLLNFVTKVDDSLDRLTRKIDDFVETTTARNAVVNNVVLELRDSQQSINASLARMESMILQLHKPNNSNEAGS